MKRTFQLIIVALSIVAGVASAASLPEYYSKAGFLRSGIIDEINLERQAIVINDQQLLLSSNVVIHSPSSYSVPVTRLRKGSKVGYKLSQNGRLIMELWILPKHYNEQRWRR